MQLEFMESTSSMEQKPILEARMVSKRFHGIQALDQVSVEIYPGEVLAIIGENGAGKSTLMKILSGVYIPDSGSIHVNGNEVSFTNPADAMKLGIGLIHQELNLAENLSIADNLFLGREITFGGIFRLLSGSQMRTQSRLFLSRVGLDEDPSVLVGDLSPGQKQLVEIARSLSLNGKVLIMDEPTSSLSQKESDRLEKVIKELSSSGVSIVYISHRLGEVQKIADRVVALKDGKNAGGLAKREIHHDSMVRIMVGRELENIPKREPSNHSQQAPRLRVTNLNYAGNSGKGSSFQVRAGEILGMAGLVGAGRTELAETLFGIRPRTAGEVFLDDKEFQPASAGDAIQEGLLLLPEDRRHHGLILTQSIRNNLSLPNLGKLSNYSIINKQKENQLASDSIRDLRIKTTSAGKEVGLLSGGNQQKVVFAKWIAAGPKVFILDEPTRGVDVGSKAEIYEIMRRLASEGVAILMISSDMEEILRLSDRVLVLHEGSLSGELSGSDINEEAIMKLATGA
ncbi:MAG: hypothetical protein RL595_3280 [Planctomycetota bacterium]